MYIIIIGCGKIGAYLAKLLDKDHNVVVVDKEEKSFEKLRDFNGSIFVGDGLDIDVLKEAGIEKADAIAVVTSNDNANIVIGQIAKKKFNISKVIIRISDPEKEEICEYLGIETINTTSIIASLLKDGLSKKVAIKHLIENGDLTIVEINSEIFINKKINEIRREELIPIAVIKNDKSIIPDDNFIIEKGDIIIGITKKNLLNKMKRILKL
ncbi:MAG: TrkA family potassium uptake protein [Candidatus Omnitrophica bacterium]|nr:TrkA family potassium uptake protein [Candidatus Omnitrophota bacterium]MCM8808553.1 TrkA family potassium uptake protein [Candidatus Omnitrophota bacterium]